METNMWLKEINDMPLALLVAEFKKRNTDPAVGLPPFPVHPHMDREKIARQLACLGYRAVPTSPNLSCILRASQEYSLATIEVKIDKYLSQLESAEASLDPDSKSQWNRVKAEMARLFGVAPSQWRLVDSNPGCRVGAVTLRHVADIYFVDKRMLDNTYLHHVFKASGGDPSSPCGQACVCLWLWLFRELTAIAQRNRPINQEDFTTSIFRKLLSREAGFRDERKVDLSLARPDYETSDAKHPAKAFQTSQTLILLELIRASLNGRAILLLQRFIRRLCAARRPPARPFAQSAVAASCVGFALHHPRSQTSAGEKCQQRSVRI